jgi:trehalose/maltose hydrolase-like predicted phosphorylase
VVAGDGRASLGSPAVSGWTLVYDGWDAAREPLREALCTLGNGLFATRGAAEESPAGGPHYPGTYLAGGYDRLQSVVSGRPVENEDLVNWPNWLPLGFRPRGGAWMTMETVEILSCRRELDMRGGLLQRRLRVRDREGRETSLLSRRLVHMGDPHLAAIEWILTAENWSGAAEIRTAIDGTVTNAGVARYRAFDGRHLQVVDRGSDDPEGVWLLARTRSSGIEMAQAARTRLFQDTRPLPVRRRPVRRRDVAGQVLALQMRQGEPVRLEKIVSLYTCRDPAISDPARAARQAIERAPSFDLLLRSHQREWSRLWRRCDIRLGGDAEAQLTLRLNIFHLLQTVSLHTVGRDVGVPARGLHGEAYRGHIFWDELFIFPFLNLSAPAVARSLKLYRYRRLEEARQAARQAGHAGAMFPWQSGSDGQEESQVIHLNPRSGRFVADETHLQRHVNAAIAFNVWQYFQATNDREFLSFYGAEMILEIARFLASLAGFDEARGRYGIHGVVGPDEYHTRYPGADRPGLDNNAYTNVMAVWTLRTARRVLDILSEGRRTELLDALQIAPAELERWDDVTHRMILPFLDGGILSQFEGYERLQEFDWDGYRRRYGDIQRLDRILEAEGDSPNRYKAAKQADVLMLFYLLSAEELGDILRSLGYPFDPAVIPRTIDYYCLRTSHGSTLSRVVHSWVLARSRRHASWHWFVEALKSDLEDIQGGTTAEGVHLGAMAGTIDLVQRCYAGVEMRDEVLWINPRLPEELSSIDLRIWFRGHWIALRVDHARLQVCVEKGWFREARIGFRGRVHTMQDGECRVFDLEGRRGAA